MSDLPDAVEVLYGPAILGESAQAGIDALFAAAGVEGEGAISLRRQADGKVVVEGRLERGRHNPNEWSDSPLHGKWHTVKLYRVVATGDPDRHDPPMR